MLYCQGAFHQAQQLLKRAKRQCQNVFDQLHLLEVFMRLVQEKLALADVGTTGFDLIELTERD